MEKTVCELFAGVGGFRCGLNHIHTLSDIKKAELWKTVWFSQWEPAEKHTQYAHDCYVYHFGPCLDLKGNNTTNYNIENVHKADIPDFNLLVGGFPCQDYSVASSLATSKGLEGKKGVLWWSIRDILEKKQPPFVLLENVDRLLKSPAKQRGRDFGVILACFRDQGYTVEWRVINAADYGYQQRRRRTFIFAYKNTTKFYMSNKVKNIPAYLSYDGFFASTFPVEKISSGNIQTVKFTSTVGEVSSDFRFQFENAGVMTNGVIYTSKTTPYYQGEYKTLWDIMENENTDVEEEYFIPEDNLYYTDHDVNHSDESINKLSLKARHTWQYIKGGKKLLRKTADGHEYIYSEGPVPMIDAYDKPARTMLTSEGSFSRTTHIVEDKKTGRIRLVTPNEAERIQGFPTDYTKYCLVNGETIEVPKKKRMFMMGNALVVDLIKEMEYTLSAIFEQE